MDKPGVKFIKVLPPAMVLIIAQADNLIEIFAKITNPSINFLK